MAADRAMLRRFWRFGLAGAAGFAVDGGLLQWLVASGWLGPIAARAVSFPVAVLVTWQLNRRFTFEDTGPAVRSLLRYLLVSSAGSAINFAVYSGLVLASATLAARPLLPFAIASGVALVFNYLGTRHFAFRAGRD